MNSGAAIPSIKIMCSRKTVNRKFIFFAMQRMHIKKYIKKSHAKVKLYQVKNRANLDIPRCWYYEDASAASRHN